MPSKLEQMQQQLRQKLLQEKEEKLIKIYNNNQQKALTRLTRSSEITERIREPQKSAPSTFLVKKTTSQVSVSSTSPHNLPIKKGSPGVDRSRPLAPLQRSKNSSNNYNTPSLSPIPKVRTNNSVCSFSTSAESPVRRNLKKLSNNDKEHKQMLTEVNQEESSLYTKVKEQQNGVESLDFVKKYTAESWTKSKHTPPNMQTVRNNKSAKSSKSLKSYSSLHNGTAIASTDNSNATKKKVISEPPPNTVTCTICNRHFAEDRIEKHVTICKKVSLKKRKVFDTTKMRLEGSEAESFVKKGVNKTELKSKKSNWRAQHESFLESIRQAKKVQQHLAAGGKLSDLPPPKPSENPDYVQCPYCNRKFNEAAAERHIPKCKNIVSNKPRNR